MPVKDQKVLLTASLGQLETTEVTTDEKGKATVTLTSTTPGTSTVGAVIGGALKLNQTLTITFE